MEQEKVNCGFGQVRAQSDDGPDDERFIHDEGPFAIYQVTFPLTTPEDLRDFFYPNSMRRKKRKAGSERPND
jgi:hypothetical protein